MIQDIDVFGVESVAEVVEFLNGDRAVEPTRVDLDHLFRRHAVHDADFSDVRGQPHVKRALEVAAAGGHNVLLMGPPGSGKTMLAKRLPTILPALTLAEALETTKIHSVTGVLDGRALVAVRPVPGTAPHHFRRRVGGRRHGAQAGRGVPGPQRRAVPRRGAGVPPQRPGSPPPAPGGRAASPSPGPPAPSTTRLRSCWWPP